MAKIKTYYTVSGALTATFADERDLTRYVRQNGPRNGAADRLESWLSENPVSAARSITIDLLPTRNGTITVTRVVTSYEPRRDFLRTSPTLKAD